MLYTFKKNLNFACNLLIKQKTASIILIFVHSSFSYFVFSMFKLDHILKNVNNPWTQILEIIYIQFFFSYLLIIAGLTIFRGLRKLTDIGIIQSLGATPLQVTWFYLIENFVLVIISVIIGPLIVILSWNLIWDILPVILGSDLPMSFINVVKYWFYTIFLVIVVNLVFIIPVYFYLSLQDPYQSIRRGR